TRLAALPGNPGATLAQLYPDLARALQGFLTDLTAIANIPANQANKDPIVAAVSSVVESGRKFIAELERVAADPTPLFIKDAIKVFADANRILRGLAGSVQDQLVGGVRAAVVQQLKNIFCKPDAPMFGIAVFGPALDTACRDLDP